MRRTHLNLPGAVATCLAAACLLSGIDSASAQQSSSYRVEGATIDAGGHPAQGSLMSSTSYRITLDSVGDPVAQRLLTSGSFHATGGLTASYPPPGEVTGLRFTGPTSLVWDSEASTGTYQIYRGAIGALPGSYGSCLLNNLAIESASDAGTPGANQGFFYLVTARNLLREEGTKGRSSAGALRFNPSPCP